MNFIPGAAAGGAQVEEHAGGAGPARVAATAPCCAAALERRQEVVVDEGGVLQMAVADAVAVPYVVRCVWKLGSFSNRFWELECTKVY